MQKEILEVIEKNLPSQTADTLRKFIDEAQKREKEINELHFILDKKDIELKDFKAKENKFKELNFREENVEFSC